MAKHVLSNRLSGIVVLVARRGQVAYVKAAGQRDIEACLPMVETNTLFRIASMSKLVTSAGMMMLIDQGAGRLDDPVSKYVPEFANPQGIVQGDRNRRTLPSIREITLRPLMSPAQGHPFRNWPLTRSRTRLRPGPGRRGPGFGLSHPPRTPLGGLS